MSVVGVIHSLWPASIKEVPEFSRANLVLLRIVRRKKKNQNWCGNSEVSKKFRFFANNKAVFPENISPSRIILAECQFGGLRGF